MRYFTLAEAQHALPEVERHRILVEWNRTERDYPQDKCLHQLFEEQVERTPDVVSVVFEGQSLTYRELNTRANQLSHHLRSLGVGPDALVGVYMERSLEMIIALLGSLKAGGAYVPIDPNDPPERVAFMIADAGASVLLTQGRLVANLPSHSAHVLVVDENGDKISHEKKAKCCDGTTSENLVYMIYTSGSTGQPKGALNTHRGICNRLLWMQEQYRPAFAAFGELQAYFAKCRSAGLRGHSSHLAPPPKFVIACETYFTS